MLWFTASAAADQIVNCNEVHFEDRCGCNAAVLRALAQVKAAVPDPSQGGGTGANAHTQVVIQQERRFQLQTFIAPDCNWHSSPASLPVPSGSSTGYGANVSGSRLRPIGARRLDEPDWFDGELRPGDPVLLLKFGRWEGWQSTAEGKATPIFLHVLDVRGSGSDKSHYVSACSDQGLVVGRVKDGVLEFARSESPAFSYSVKLWKSGPPYYRDLEGVALLRIRPTQDVVAGLVWLSRSPKLDGMTLPARYSCQDRSIEDERLRNELDAIKQELEMLKRRR
jgi:hypothetical protein